MKTQKLRRFIAAAAVAFAGLAVAGPAAQAATGPVFTVMNTSETPPDGVYFRNSPHTADTSRTYGLGVFMNDRVQLQCYAWGDAVGPYSDTLWYLTNNVTRETYNGGKVNQGYLNAHYVNDGQNANVVAAGVPECVNGAPPVVAPPAPGQRYNRAVAQAWARVHVGDPELIKNGDCTWFVSQALWAGGLPQSSTWARVSPNPIDRGQPTSTAKFSDQLPRYLASQKLAEISIISWTDNTAHGAQVGDIIAYDWDGVANGTYDHLAIVTGFSETYPLVSQHTTARWNRGWSWDPSANNWIEYSHRGSAAYLIHITY